MIPAHYKNVHNGFWSDGDFKISKSAQKNLSMVADHFFESLYHAKQAISFPPNKKNLKVVNWYTSAHMVAYVSAVDAIRLEVEQKYPNVNFKNTPLGKEFVASETTEDPFYKDPVNASHLYRVKRNMRVHLGESIIAFKKSNFFSSKEPHFYFKQIDFKKYAQTRNPLLNKSQIKKYNGYLEMDTIIDVFGRMLGILAENIEKTNEYICNEEAI